ncbi:MAG: hypothetical protein MUO77_03790, partial [Anaerolineales bacterium]|nr:hypothetical protein [Anaerolineales bacterium]
NNRSNSGALVGGSLLIAFGVLAALQQIFRDVFTWSLVWPIIVIVFGGMFFAGMFAGGKQVSGLAIPGSIITGIGLLLFYQNLTGHWESWSYGWALIVLFVGIGIYIMGLYGGDVGQKAAGQSVMRVGFILFVIFGAFFELIFSSGSAFGMHNLLFPILLIVLGVYLIVTRLGWFSGRKSDMEMPVSASESEDKK